MVEKLRASSLDRVPMACLNLTPRGIAFEVVLFGWIEKEGEKRRIFAHFKKYRFEKYRRRFFFLSLSASRNYS